MVMSSGHSRIHEIARIGAISIAVALEPLKPRWKSLAAIFAVTLLSAVYWGPQDFLAEDVLETPPLESRSVTASVQVGGDFIGVIPESGSGRMFTVCFYHDGYAVGAAHSIDTDDGPWTTSTKFIPAAMVRGEPEFVTSTPYGVILSGLGPPDEARECLEIGNTEDIAVGDEAVLYSSWKGPVRVVVLGFTARGKEQLLAFQFCESDQTMEGGMSGSPIVQDGRVIAFASMTLSAVSWKRPQIGLARLAADVYLGVQPYLE